MVDIEDDDSPAIVIDAVPHAILPPARPPQALEWLPQWDAHGSRPLG